MTPTLSPPHRTWLLAVATVIVAGCQSPPTAIRPIANPTSSTNPSAMPAQQGPAHVSTATTARAYRQDAAAHLYARNAQRIYHGKLPPLLYAIGTLNVDIDTTGHVTALHWLRAPGHAPEVIAEIERTVRAAAPYPVAQQLGSVTYTDTWLWDLSGRFQLDTLSEGQE